MSRPGVEVTPASRFLSAWLDLLGGVPAVRPAEALGLGTGATALLVGAHPDDETFGAGGTIAALGADGVTVHVVSMSSGEAALDHVGVSVPRLDRRRRRELTAAAAALGVATAVALDFPDGGLADHEVDIEAAIVAAAEMHDVHRVLTVAWCDPHPDHAATGRAAVRAAAHLGVPVSGFLIWALHWTDPRDPVMEAKPLTAMLLDEHARSKRAAAARCYVSQTQPLAAGVDAVLPSWFVANDVELMIG